jgi:hypothetical protein
MDKAQITHGKGTSKMWETINILNSSYVKDQGDRRIILRWVLQQNIVRMRDDEH